MSYDQEKYYQTHVTTWKKFVKVGLYITIGIIVTLILMTMFLV
ncbi:MAG: hypothetical protein CMJ09_02670 [Pelagibacterales bacterium]|nr:hypothetical protein [Pelagibacterales bacterium]